MSSFSFLILLISSINNYHYIFLYIPLASSQVKYIHNFVIFLFKILKKNYYALFFDLFKSIFLNFTKQGFFKLSFCC